MLNRAFVILFFVFATFALGAQAEPPSLKRNASPPHSATTESRIDGAGSLAIDPLLSAWINEYSHQHPRARISYQAIGSQAGLRMLTARTTFFGATDIPHF